MRWFKRKNTPEKSSLGSDNIIKQNKKEKTENIASDEQTQTKQWLEFSTIIVDSLKEIPKAKKKLVKQKQAKKFAIKLINLYEYFLAENIDKYNALVYQDNKYKYYAYVNQKDNTFNFIVYNIDDEAIVNAEVNDKLMESVHSVQAIEEETLKEALKSLKDNKQTTQLVILGVLLVAIGGGVYFVMKPKKVKPIPKPIVNVLPQPKPKPKKPPTFNPTQEFEATALAEAQCFTKLDTKLKELKSKGIIVSNVSVHINPNPSNVSCSYNITAKYTYPAVGTQLQGEHYVKTDNGSVNVSYQDFISSAQYIENLFANADFIKCLNFAKEMGFVLTSRPAVLQANFSLNKQLANKDAIYDAGMFLSTLENICGYTMGINNFNVTNNSVSAQFAFNWNTSSQPSAVSSINTTANPNTTNPQQNKQIIVKTTNNNIQINQNNMPTTNVTPPNTQLNTPNIQQPNNYNAVRR